jgi:hypothetical protein
LTDEQQCHIARLRDAANELELLYCSISATNELLRATLDNLDNTINNIPFAIEERRYGDIYAVRKKVIERLWPMHTPQKRKRKTKHNKGR